MGIRSLETAILKELRSVTGDKKLRQRDIVEYSTAKIEPREEGEKTYFLPQLKIYCTVDK